MREKERERKRERERERARERERDHYLIVQMFLDRERRERKKE